MCLTVVCVESGSSQIRLNIIITAHTHSYHVNHKIKIFYTLAITCGCAYA